MHFIKNSQLMLISYALIITVNILTIGISLHLCLLCPDSDTSWAVYQNALQIINCEYLWWKTTTTICHTSNRNTFCGECDCY